jgi:hypothetical protein
MSDEQPPRRPRGGIVKEILTDKQLGEKPQRKPDRRGRPLLLPISGGRRKPKSAAPKPG